MFLRKYWLPLSMFLVLIVGIGLYLLATQPSKEPTKIYKVVEPIEKPTQQPTTAQAPVDDTSQGGHFHADGTWHEGPHEQVATAQAPQTAPQAQETLSPEEADARSTANLLDHLQVYIPLAEKNRDILQRTYENRLRALTVIEKLEQRKRPGNRIDLSHTKRRVAEAKARLDAKEQDIANLKKWRNEHAKK